MQGYVIVDLKAILQLEQQCRRATTVPTGLLFILQAISAGIFLHQFMLMLHV